MNCANHPEIAAAAYCRTCGKPLCTNCTRNVRGVIYCENCLAERLEGVQPPQNVYQPVMDPGAAMRVQPIAGTGPNPTVAGILAGFFPFGVGAVYCGQYARALAHLLIFVGLIFGVSHTGGFGATLFGLAIGFFYFYQIIDAVRTARALQLGQPIPDPLGLAQTFSPGAPGEKIETSRIPVAAIVLIGLGVLFLLDTLNIWSFDANRVWPLILVVIGGFLLARRQGWMGPAPAYDCDRCRARSLMGPAIVLTIGVLFLLENNDVVRFGRTWPLILVVVGLVKVLQSSASTAGHVERTLPTPPVVVAPVVPPSAGAPTQPPSPVPPPPPSEVHNG